MNQPAGIPEMIDRLLKNRDPATVGLRRILKKKEEEGKAFPLRTPSFEPFDDAERGKKIFTAEERRVIELEKQVCDLRDRIERAGRDHERAMAAAVEKARGEGHEEGTREGYAAAREEFERAVGEVQERVGAVLESLDRSRQEVFANAYHIVLRLATTLAQKVIQAELRANPESILSVVKKALSYIADRERLIVRVARDDLETVTRRKDFWMPVSERCEKLTVEPDERIEKGGCIIESNSGVADARLGVQFQDLGNMIEELWWDISNNSVQPPESSTQPREPQQ